MNAPVSALVASLAVREGYRDHYWDSTDPIADDRLLWRAQSIRHTAHVLPGQTILELGAGSGRFTRALQRVVRGENPLTAVSFRTLPAARGGTVVEGLKLEELPGPLAGRQFDCIVMMDLLDRENCAELLGIVHGLLKPGGELITYESNPWNPVHKFRWVLSRIFGRKDPRYLINQTKLYEQMSEIGFVRVYAVFNDFVFPPLTGRLIWLLRNLSILLENSPGLRRMAGSILLHAQKPPREKAPPSLSLCRHAALRGTVSVVIPCRNEDMNIGLLVRALITLYGDYLREIVTVDDGSTDQTRQVMAELAAGDSRVRPLIRVPPHGVGHAIREGLRAAQGEWILTMDCDFQHLLPEFRDLFDHANANWDVVVGSRFSRHSVLLNYPFLKILANRAFHSLARLFLGVRCRDLTNNLKLMRRTVVAELDLRQPGFAVNAETGFLPVLRGYRVKEVPISWINRTPGMGVSSFKLARVGGGYWEVLRDLWRSRISARGPYRRLRERKPSVVSTATLPP
ncbi:MAG TPA: glycosyltransferase [Lacunisphaera sp.]|nr:glycosyltransferase [Lacunisphaera sp.]